MPSELLRQACAFWIVVCGGKCKSEWGESGCSQKSLRIFTQLKSKSSVVVVAGSGPWAFSPALANFFFHCLALFPAVPNLAASYSGSFWFPSYFWSSAWCLWVRGVCGDNLSVSGSCVWRGEENLVKPVAMFAFFVLRLWSIFRYLIFMVMIDVVAGFQWNDSSNARCCWWAWRPPPRPNQEGS